MTPCASDLNGLSATFELPNDEPSSVTIQVNQPGNEDGTFVCELQVFTQEGEVSGRAESLFLP